MGEEILDSYYAKKSEEERLIKDNAHKVEFDITMPVLNKYIGKKPLRILDVAAGTGRYAFYFARRGHKVFALDIVERHVERMRELARQSEIEITVAPGDAQRLPQAILALEFDMVLCMGPIYHLADLQARKRCILECTKPLKQSGILAIAYLNKEVRPNDKSGSCFYSIYPAEIINTAKNNNLEVVDHLATDGISPKIGEYLNALSDEGYKAWAEFMLKTCRESASIKNTLHGLVICKRK